MKEMIQRLLDFTGDGVYQYTFDDGRLVLANRGFCRILDLDCPPEDVIGKPLRDLLIYTEREGTVRHALEATGEVHGFHYHFKTLKGEDRWVLHDSFLRQHGATGARVVEAIVKDITKLKKAEEALQYEKERLAVTLRSIGDAVMATDTEGCIVLLNGVAESLTGWSEREAQGRPMGEVFRIINEETREACEDPVSKVTRTGRVVGLANHTLLIARDGTERTIADSGAPIRDHEGRVTGVVLVFRDVTEARLRERERQRIERLESVGVLAGGIAHDFNNLLTAILGNLSLARIDASCRPDSRCARLLFEAERACVRAGKLTQQLLSFARGGAPMKEAASLADIICESARFALRGSSVLCECEMAPDLWLVEVDKGQISQVIHNLAINAEQAMPGGGRMQIRAVNERVPDGSPLPLPAGSYVRVDVSDSGVGIPAKILPRIFDPYFTTKQKGSGLGLTVSHSVIEKHGGHIRVESVPGKGTAFHLYLPAVEQAVLVAELESATRLPAPARVLFMDDEEALRATGTSLLTRLGCDVEAVADGDAALLRYAAALESGRPFDVVILDLTVPAGMGGVEAVKRLQAMDPTVRAVVSSGYSDDTVLASPAAFGFAAILPKPYRLEDLVRALKAALGSRR